MGFFDKVFKSDKKEQKHQNQSAAALSFSPFITKTESVPDTLREAALKYKISPHQLDFRIISTQTLIKVEDKENDWIEVEPDDWENFNKPEILLTPKFQIKQVHEIEVTRYKEEPWERDLMIHLASNKEKTRVVCTVKAGSVVRYMEDLDLKIKHKIHKQMVKAKILIDLWDLEFMKKVDELVAKARVNGEFILKEDVKIDVAACYASVPSVDDALILHYQEKLKQPENSEKIDYSKRGFVQAVEKGEVIIEYIKPREGRPGRNCRGEFIPVDEPKENHKPDFKVTDNIEIEETEEAILYRAKKGGYVVKEGEVYDIRDEMELEEVSFKKTGSIDAGVETEVKLHINEKDFLKDAVGTGVEVEATEVKVEGNVGGSAVVRAEKVEIGGQTHQTSEIYAEEATVNVVRGLLKVKGDAKVTRLEGGHVEARKVEVGQMIGGEIRALEAHVKLLASNTKIFAVTRIEIDEMNGENNHLAIDPANIEAYHDEIVRLEREVEELKEEIEKRKRVLAERLELKEKSDHAVQILKQKIINDKKRGLPVKPAFIAKIKQYQKLIEKIDKLEKEIDQLKTRRTEVRNKLIGYQDMVLQARIVCHGTWQEYTRIAFHLLYPETVLEFVPKAGTENQEIYLKKVSDEEDEEPVYEVAVKDLEA